MSHKTLNLDLAKTPILKSIVYGRIGDEDMQTVTVNITSRDTPVDLTGFTITFEGITSGGQTKVFDVDGISSTATGLKAGTFEYTFPNMAFAVAGNYEIAYFSIVKGDKRDTTGEFDIIVDGNADIDAPLAETIITEYNKLVKELHQITDKYISDSDAKFADLNQKIADLQTKITQYQNTVKNTADTAVSTINTTKDSAVSTINSTKDSAVSTVNTAASSAVKTINDALEEFKAGDFYTKAESDAKFATIQSLTDLSNKVVANKGNIASGTDLDNVIDIGTYRIGGLTGGTDIINVPSERSGTTIYAYLTVSGTTTSVVQELIVYDSKTVSQIYSRSRSGSTPTFSPWSKTVMADDSGKVTVTGTLEMGKTATLTQSTGFGRTAIFTRVGNLVTVYSESRHTTAPPNGWNREVATLPVGWRPIGNSCLWQHDLSNSTKFSWLEVHSSGQVDLYASGGIATSDYMLSASCVYITKDPFPES
ncbi:BppU family phage baseplate upper protein [Lactococcus lactis]|uniref:BppU family phage baseplate upper protein n=1 Tax=Lactococcus lactis TaxID=1358 RepID=UPI001914039F|nr:BppU family phage baseplate upper protein [Lactococcus lactis]WDA68309.1 BppU family phage baseplate upper protein [Lactococcus lactis]